ATLISDRSASRRSSTRPEEVDDDVSEHRSRTALAAIPPGFVHRHVMRPAVVQPFELAMSGQARVARVDEAGDLLVVRAPRYLVELTVESEDRHVNCLPCGGNVDAGELGEESIRSSRVRGRGSGERPEYDHAFQVMLGRQHGCKHAAERDADQKETLRID